MLTNSASVEPFFEVVFVDASKMQSKELFEQRNDLPPEPPDLLGALKSCRELLVLILQLISTTALATSRI